MFQIIDSPNEKYNPIIVLAGLIIIFESLIKCFPHRLSLEFIYNFCNNLILNILLCSFYCFIKCNIFIELYVYLFLYTNIYKILFSKDKFESIVNIFIIWYCNKINYIFFLSNFGYIFFYLKELKIYSGLIEEEYYIYHQLYLFLFRFIPLCYLLFEGELYSIIYIILISFKILNI